MLGFADAEGVEPPRVFLSELFSRQWPPPIGLSIQADIVGPAPTLGTASGPLCSAYADIDAVSFD